MNHDRLIRCFHLQPDTAFHPAMAAGISKTAHQPGQIDHRKRRCVEVGIKAAGGRYIRDKTVKPLHISQDDIHQFLLLFLVINPGNGLNRAAEGGQRVLDLMGDIRRE